MKKLILLSLITLFISCNQKNNDQKIESKHNVTNDDALIREKLKTMYDKVGRSLDLTDTIIFSKAIVAEMKKCNDLIKADIERLSKLSKEPMKPIGFEGSMVTSLMEGHSSYEIETIEIKNNITEVNVALTNKTFNPIPKWKDKVILVNENGWKIDNVIFDQNEQKDMKDLKFYLKKFIDENSK